MNLGESSYPSDSMRSDGDRDGMTDSNDSSIMYQSTDISSITFADSWGRRDSTTELSRRRPQQQHPQPPQRNVSSGNISGRHDDSLHVLVLWTAGLALLAAVVAFFGVMAVYEIPKRLEAQEGSLLSLGTELLGTASPSSMPSYAPSSSPSSSPTHKPSSLPSFLPSSSPTSEPSFIPTREPSVSPTSMPTSAPSEAPTQKPSTSPSSSPSSSPSHRPSAAPSVKPSILPSSLPTSHPTSPPSSQPTSSPTRQPTSMPSLSPSSSPTSSPSAPPTGPPSSSPTYTPVIFYVMGDVPYSDEEAEKLKRQVQNIPDDAEFVVHVGDIHKVENTNCTQDVYTTMSSILRACDYPVFILPGDNDIIECPSPFLARFFWTQSFRAFESNWKNAPTVRRPTNRYENFAFFLNNVLFLGVDITGSGGYVEEQRSSRLQNDLDWALKEMSTYEDEMTGLVIFGHARPKNKYRDFFRPLAKIVKQHGYPCLYIHGNGHKWEHEEEAFKSDNILRVQVDRGGYAEPVRVKFRRDAEHPFEFDRRK